MGIFRRHFQCWAEPGDDFDAQQRDGASGCVHGVFTRARPGRGAYCRLRAPKPGGRVDGHLPDDTSRRCVLRHLDHQQCAHPSGSGTRGQAVVFGGESAEPPSSVGHHRVDAPMVPRAVRRVSSSPCSIPRISRPRRTRRCVATGLPLSNISIPASGTSSRECARGATSTTLLLSSPATMARCSAITTSGKSCRPCRPRWGFRW